MSDHAPNNGGHSGLPNAAPAGDCTECGDNSHILMPLADLLRAVAATIQTNSHQGEPARVDFGAACRHDAQQRTRASFADTLGNMLAPRNDSFFHKGRTIDPAHSPPPAPPRQPEPVRQEQVRGDAADSVAGKQDDSTAAKQAPARATVDSASAGETAPSTSDTGETKDETEAPAAHDTASPGETAPSTSDTGETETEAESTTSASEPSPKLRSRLFSFTKHGSGKHQDPWPDEEDQLPKQPRFRLFQGVDGIAVMLFGVLFPAFIILGTCGSVPKRMSLILLEHPLETIVQMVLIALVPIINLRLWSALKRDDVRFSLMRGVGAGSAFITSMAVAVVALSALSNNNGAMLQSEIGTTFEAGFTWLAALCMMAAGATGYIVYQFIKTRDFLKSRKLIVAYTAVGAAISAIALVGSEAKSWYVRIAERMAVSSNEKDRAEGIARLRNCFSERDLRMECTDARSAGLVGLFYPIKSSAQQELYFKVTGEPFSFKDEHNDIAVMPDDYVSRHAVGDPIDGLGLIRSEMSASVRPATLTTAIDWTFVYRNESNSEEQARTEISLPPGAVITGMTQWIKGEQVKAVFTAGKSNQDAEYSSSSSSAAVTDLGHGRALLRCSGVQSGAELKMSIHVIAPLKPESATAHDGKETATLLLPKIIATNYSLYDENAVKLYSPLPITSQFAELKQTTLNGVQRLFGVMNGKQLESAEVLVTVERPEPVAIAVLDKSAVKLAQQDERRRAVRRRSNHGNYAPLPQQLSVIIDGRQGIQTQLAQLSANLNHHRDHNGLRPEIKVVKPIYVTETVTRVKATAPKHLIIVVDGSESMKSQIADLKKALQGKSIPGNHVDMMIASQDKPDLTKMVPLSKGLTMLEEKNFSGGQNNLKTVIDAAEEAGSAQGGAVLWVHGPQPISDGSIYITTPYASHPELFEMPTAKGEIDTGEFFKNHNDIGQFMQVSHQGKLSKDIACFFEKWQPNSVDYSTALATVKDKPASVHELSDAEGKDLLLLNAYNQAIKLLSERKPGTAARIAFEYGVLTPVTSLMIENNQSEKIATAAQLAAQAQVQAQDADDANQSGFNQAPALQGATNGTLGPQGSDATYVVGVNTAGTVRVNNLANLEALVNLLANGSEIIFGIMGLVYCLGAFRPQFKGNQLLRVGLGIGIIMFGLMIPGVFNFLIASARDANLFS